MSVTIWCRSPSNFFYYNGSEGHKLRGEEDRKCRCYDLLIITEVRVTSEGGGKIESVGVMKVKELLSLMKLNPLTH